VRHAGNSGSFVSLDVNVARVINRSREAVTQIQVSGARQKSKPPVFRPLGHSRGVRHVERGRNQEASETGENPPG
jgi:hypothetical protein